MVQNGPTSRFPDDKDAGNDHEWRRGQRHDVVTVVVADEMALGPALCTVCLKAASPSRNRSRLEVNSFR